MKERKFVVKPLKPRHVGLGEDMFPSTEVSMTAIGAEICYFQWKTLEQYVLKEKERRGMSTDIIEPKENYGLEDYFIGYFAESGGGLFGRSAIKYRDIAAFVEAFKIHCPRKPAKSHFICRGTIDIGQYTKEGFTKRVADLLYLSEKEKEYTWKESFLGKEIIAEYLVFHVPNPNNEENAKNLAKLIGKIWANMYMDIDIVWDKRHDHIKRKYLIVDD